MVCVSLCLLRGLIAFHSERCSELESALFARFAPGTGRAWAATAINHCHFSESNLVSTLLVGHQRRKVRFLFGACLPETLSVAESVCVWLFFPFVRFRPGRKLFLGLSFHSLRLVSFGGASSGSIYAHRHTPTLPTMMRLCFVSPLGSRGHFGTQFI